MLTIFCERKTNKNLLKTVEKTYQKSSTHNTNKILYLVDFTLYTFEKL